MFCRKCGAENPAGVLKCTECGASLQPAVPSGTSSFPLPEVPNYLAFAILVTVYCCMPFGIPALIFATRVNTKLLAGDYNSAVEASDKAKTWCWVSFGVGLGFWAVYFVFLMVTIISQGFNF